MTKATTYLHMTGWSRRELGERRRRGNGGEEVEAAGGQLGGRGADQAEQLGVRGALLLGSMYYMRVWSAEN